MDLLYFHDLPPAEEGAYLVSRPPELADLVERQFSTFQRDESAPEPTVPVVGFIVRGPERVDRYGLMVRESDLDGTVEENADAIRRTSPTGWEVLTRMTMV